MARHVDVSVKIVTRPMAWVQMWKSHRAATRRMLKAVPLLVGQSIASSHIGQTGPHALSRVELLKWNAGER